MTALMLETGRAVYAAPGTAAGLAALGAAATAAGALSRSTEVMDPYIPDPVPTA